MVKTPPPARRCCMDLEIVIHGPDGSHAGEAFAFTRGDVFRKPETTPLAPRAVAK
jgi:hypothetical protein